MTAQFHPKAEWEFLDASEYYSGIDSLLGARFDHEIQRMLDVISQDPHLHARVSGDARRIFSMRFPYALIYLPRGDHVWIVAVMHLHRDPNYWVERVG